MRRLFGYVVSFVGLFLMVVGFGLFRLDLGFSSSLLSSVPVVGVVCIVVGSFIIVKSPSGVSKKSKPEVPIYEGEKIVGYRRH